MAGRAIRSSGKASWVGWEPLGHPDSEPEPTPPFFLLPQPALGLGTRQRGGQLTLEQWDKARVPQEGGLQGDLAPSHFTMHQGSGRGQVCMLCGTTLHGLLLTLSPVTHPHSLPRCVLSWMSGNQSRCTVPTGQRPPLCAGRGLSIPLPHLC